MNWSLFVTLFWGGVLCVGCESTTPRPRHPSNPVETAGAPQCSSSSVRVRPGKGVGRVSLGMTIEELAAAGIQTREGVTTNIVVEPYILDLTEDAPPRVDTVLHKSHDWCIETSGRTLPLTRDDMINKRKPPPGCEYEIDEDAEPTLRCKGLGMYFVATDIPKHAHVIVSLPDR